MVILLEEVHTDYKPRMLATTATICYAAFMTSHRYHLIPPWTSPVRTRRLPHEPLTGKIFPGDASTSTCSEGRALADKIDSPCPSPDLADPIVEPEAALAEGEPQVLEDFPRSQPLSIFVQSEARLDSKVDASESEGSQVEEPQLELPDVDPAIAHLPSGVASEIESGAIAQVTVTEPPVVDIQETADASLRLVSGGSDESQRNVESVESLVVGPGFFLQAHTPADVEASMSIETPFLLFVDSGSSVEDDATLGEEGSFEDHTCAAEPPTGGGLAESVLGPSPRSISGSLHDNAPSFIMQSAVLVPVDPVTNEGASSSDPVAGLDGEDDWTSVDPDEPSTPRPSSPADPESRIEEPAGEVQIAESDLAVSAVLLTQSQYASTILPPISANDGSLPSPTSSTSSPSARPRVHTFDRPDWAVAPQGEQENVTRRERTLRRHSVDSPDWAVAPDATENDASSEKKKGRRSDPGSGRRRKSRRAWTSR
ncbi:hypothetical protein GSI_05831 [Ganoderma sinense ZZ0214-1]|uniref:Uncharacterized protein n=1 Tax=Ganoderma sinense ZZ0214-1 TaxID=1077348 RepID=A0A2G8SBI9_9APHY|nr:hypothetical protein GSI_05831 [Ganoderma sinense ZZ0214-1]